MEKIVKKDTTTTDKKIKNSTSKSSKEQLDPIQWLTGC